MKKIILLLMILINTFCLVSCQDDEKVIYLKRPENTNIQYWITEDFTGKPLNGHFILEEDEEKVVFYGVEYIPYELNGEMIHPNVYVKYTISAYPDSTYDERFITNIYITDLTVDIYGVNLTNSFKEFDEAMKEAGFKITKKNKERHIAKKDNITIYFCESYIEITANIYE